MNLPASMQWDLLPPLSLVSPRVSAAGMLEPAYEIGGDCFDYALNGTQLDMALMDSMGHGLRSAMVAGLAVGCYRHDRREGRTLEHIHRELDATIAGECRGEAFVTGDIGRLDLNTGTLTWINAGHPAPMLIRHGRVIATLDSAPALPWGLGPSDAETATCELEPGDCVLFYTDGVTEARGVRGEDFGPARLADLVGKHANDQLPIGLIVRLIVRAVREHHNGVLLDDASVLMIQWPGPLNDGGANNNGQ
jgi:serine phosphatase RsbU (regulator of sigma subunit)